MTNEHVATWTASVHVTMFSQGSACVYIVHIVKTSIRNYFAKPRRNCFEFRVYSLQGETKLYAFYLNELNRNINILQENMIQIYVNTHSEENICVIDNSHMSAMRYMCISNE